MYLTCMLIYSVSCAFLSVPDLSEYTVQVGLLHLNASSGTQDLRIAHVVCGPEGSNLALLKLTT